MKFTFKPFSGNKESRQDSPDDPPNAQARRKDQIRRAQKTHRERKEAYTKSLEGEVVQLRANEAKILQETRHLYKEINLLRQLLVQHGIPVPIVNSGQDDSDDGSPGPSSFQFAIGPDPTSRNSPRRINVQRYEGSQSGYQYSGSEFSSQSPEGFVHPTTFHALTTSVSPPSAEIADMTIFDLPEKKLHDMDQAAVGIEFVLSLESPCLDHVAPASPDVTGHSLMVSATLLHQHPAPPEERLGPKHQPWRVSGTGIERLLELSKVIELDDGELTPVQAWDLLRKHPEFNGLESKRLDKLKDTLLKHVKCYGFGGVVTQDAFDSAVYEAFVIGRVF